MACKHSAMPRVNAWPGKQGKGAIKARYEDAVTARPARSDRKDKCEGDGVQTQRHAASKRMTGQARDGGEKAALWKRSHGKTGAQRQERQVRRGSWQIPRGAPCARL